MYCFLGTLVLCVALSGADVFNVSVAPVVGLTLADGCCGWSFSENMGVKAPEDFGDDATVVEFRDGVTSTLRGGSFLELNELVSPMVDELVLLFRIRWIVVDATFLEVNMPFVHVDMMMHLSVDGVEVLEFVPTIDFEDAYGDWTEASAVVNSTRLPFAWNSSFAVDFKFDDYSDTIGPSDPAPGGLFEVSIDSVMLNALVDAAILATDASPVSVSLCAELCSFSVVGSGFVEFGATMCKMYDGPDFMEIAGTVVDDSTVSCPVLTPFLNYFPNVVISLDGGLHYTASSVSVGTVVCNALPNCVTVACGPTPVGYCVECEPGYYPSGDASDTCVACPIVPVYCEQPYCEDGDSSTCLVCETGAELIGSACESCPVNTYAADDDECTDCPVGSVTLDAGAVPTDPIHHLNFESCLCGAGLGTTVSGCTACPDDTYSEGLSHTCTDCPEFSTSVGGVDDVAGCVCVAGTYRADDECFVCSDDRYSEDTDALDCSLCHPNSVTFGEDATDHDSHIDDCLCVAGYFQETSTTNVTVCSLCPVGTYKGVDGNGPCTPCPANAVGRAGVNGGTTVGAACECEDGFYWDVSDKCAACFVGCSVCTDGGWLVDVCTCDEGLLPSLFIQAVLDLAAPEYGTALHGMVASVDGECVQLCPVGQRLVLGNCERCGKGFHGLAASDLPDGMVDVDEIALTTAEDVVDLTAISLEVCTECDPGMFMETEGAAACFPCPVGSFAFKPGAELCRPCPEGSTCGVLGTAVPTTAPGYWQSDKPAGDGTPQFLKCANAEACPGGSDACGAGYQGNVCAECSPGYYRLEGACLKCPETSIVRLIIIGAVLFFIMLLLLKVAKSMSALKINVASLSIAVSYIQMTALFASIAIDWPPRVKQILTWFSVLNFNFDLASPECSVPVSWGTKWMVYLSLPFVFLFFIAVWYIAAHCGPCKADSFADLRAQLISSYGTVLNICYIFLASKSLELFRCVEQTDGSFFLESYPPMNCYESDWYQLLPAALLGNAMFTLGIPVLFAVILFIVYPRWNKHGKRLKFRQSYGFLIVRYDRLYYYWELYNMMRKLAVVSIIVLVTEVFTQTLSLLVIAFLSMLIHFSTKPYLEDKDDNLESFLLLAEYLVLFVGILVHSDGLSDGVKDVISQGLVIIIAISLLAIIVAVSMEVRQILLTLRHRRLLTEESLEEIVQHGSLIFNKKGFNRFLNWIEVVEEDAALELRDPIVAVEEHTHKYRSQKRRKVFMPGLDAEVERWRSVTGEEDRVEFDSMLAAMEAPRFDIKRALSTKTEWSLKSAAATAAEAAAAAQAEILARPLTARKAEAEPEEVEEEKKDVTIEDILASELAAASFSTVFDDVIVVKKKRKRRRPQRRRRKRSASPASRSYSSTADGALPVPPPSNYKKVEKPFEIGVTADLSDSEEEDDVFAELVRDATQHRSQRTNERPRAAGGIDWSDSAEPESPFVPLRRA